MKESKIVGCQYGDIYFDEKDMQYKRKCKLCESTKVVNENNIVFPTIKEQLALARKNLERVRSLYPSLLATYEQTFRTH